MSERQTARYEISQHMMGDIAADLAARASWADLEDQYGIPAASLKRAYLRKSAETYRTTSQEG
jgi:hypothetical protein